MSKKATLISKMQASTRTVDPSVHEKMQDSQVYLAEKEKEAEKKDVVSKRSDTSVEDSEDSSENGNSERKSESPSGRPGVENTEEASEDSAELVKKPKPKRGPLELESSDEEGMEDVQEKEVVVAPTKQDREVLEYARDTGKLPCVLWQPNNPKPTFCEKDLATGRYTVMGDDEDMTATDLIKLYGPKGGWQNRMPNAIHIVQFVGQQDALPHPSHPDDHASHAEWYEQIWKNGEMQEIEKLHKQKAGIKTKATVKKRKDSKPPSTVQNSKKAKVEKEKKKVVNLPSRGGAARQTKQEASASVKQGGEIVEYDPRTSDMEKELQMKLPSGLSIDLFMKLDPMVQKEMVLLQKMAVEGLQKAEERKGRTEDLKTMAEILGMSGR